MGVRCRTVLPRFFMPTYAGSVSERVSRRLWVLIPAWGRSPVYGPYGWLNVGIKIGALSAFAESTFPFDSYPIERLPVRVTCSPCSCRSVLPPCESAPIKARHRIASAPRVPDLLLGASLRSPGNILQLR